MIRILKQKAILADFILLLAAILFWVSMGNLFNVLAFSLVLVLILQLIYRNCISGIIIASAIVALGVFMLLALFSEVSEFSSFNSEAKHMLTVGLGLFLPLVVLGIIMFIKYFRASLE